MNVSNSESFRQYLKLYKEKNPHLKQQKAVQQAKESYQQLKKIYQQKGGFSYIDLNNAQLRYEAGVTPLNSGLADIGRSIKF